MALNVTKNLKIPTHEPEYDCHPYGSSMFYVLTRNASQKKSRWYGIPPRNRVVDDGSAINIGTQIYSFERKVNYAHISVESNAVGK